MPPQAKPTMPTMIRMTPIIPAGFTLRILERPPAANQLQNEHHQGDHQQDVNVRSQNVEADKSKQPEDQQDHKDSPKHNFLSVEVVDFRSLDQAHPRVTKSWTTPAGLLFTRLLEHAAQVPPVLFQLGPGRVVIGLH